jgi:MoxR-like ATPase
VPWDQLQKWIHGDVSADASSVFMFDEIDKLHPGILNAIKPFLDDQELVGGISYRKAIFIFLSNAEKLPAGRKRDKIQPKDLEPMLSVIIFNNRHNT